jgi:hypothetical protein
MRADRIVAVAYVTGSPRADFCVVDAPRSPDEPCRGVLPHRPLTRPRGSGISRFTPREGIFKHPATNSRRARQDALDISDVLSLIRASCASARQFP